jgi:hypothetical protein
MATILRFDTARRAFAPRGGAHKGPAKILFFTGVRYERQPTQSLIEQKTARSKARHGTGRAGTLPDLTV